MEENNVTKKEEDYNLANTPEGKANDDKKKRDIFIKSGIAILALGVLVLGLSQWSKYQQKNEIALDVVEVEKKVKPQKEEAMSYLKEKNQLYKAGVDASLAGDKLKALELLEKSKVAETSVSAKGIIDFTIATVNFDLNRSKGVDGLMNLSENTEYSNRIRALAMVRSYLYYLAYNDTELLRNIASSSDIVWTNSDAVTIAYMKKITDLHPFAYPMLRIMSYELDAMEKKGDKVEAQRIYDQYRVAINKDIEVMKSAEGERTELTSTWLANANMLARLHIEYGIGERASVEKEFKSLIEYDRLYMLKVNEQYALLSYANFLSGLNDYVSAEKMILEIVVNGVTPALVEALPKINMQARYPHLGVLVSKLKDSRARAFLSKMGSKVDIEVNKKR
jgi:hypothetical protein